MDEKPKPEHICSCGRRMRPSERPLDREGTLRCPLAGREPGHQSYVEEVPKEVGTR